MTIEAGYAPIPYLTSGIGPYAFNWRVLQADDVYVTFNGVLIPASNYTVTLNPDQNVDAGGTLLFSIAPADDIEMEILRVTDTTQLVDYTEYGSFPSAAHEFALDKLTLLAQELYTGQAPQDSNNVTVNADDWVRLNSPTVPASVQEALDNTDYNMDLLFLSTGPSGPLAVQVAANTAAIEDNDIDIAANTVLANGKVDLTGDIMSGPLTLSANALNPLHAVPLQQLTDPITGYMPLSGATMVGLMTLSADAVNPLHPASFQQLTAVENKVDGLGDNILHTYTDDLLLMAANPVGPLVTNLPLDTPDIYLAVRTQLNSAPANALAQLDASGLIPADILPISDTTLIGVWNPVVDGQNPPVQVSTGQYSIFSAAGDMLLFTTDDQTSHLVAVNGGDSMISLIGATGYLDGWYHLAAAQATNPTAAQVSFDIAGSAFVGTTVQEVLNEIEGVGGVNAFLKLAGGTVTGQILGITPTAAAHLTRKDYVDNLVAAADGQNVKITGDQAIDGIKTFNSTISGSINGNAATATNATTAATATNALACSGNSATATTAAACTGNSATVTNGVYTVGNQDIAGIKRFTAAQTHFGTAGAGNSLTIDVASGAVIKNGFVGQLRLESVISNEDGAGVVINERGTADVSKTVLASKKNTVDGAYLALYHDGNSKMTTNKDGIDISANDYLQWGGRKINAWAKVDMINVVLTGGRGVASVASAGLGITDVTLTTPITNGSNGLCLAVSEASLAPQVCYYQWQSASVIRVFVAAEYGAGTGFVPADWKFTVMVMDGG